jgi:uncharacterized protein (TIGR02001 family)
MNKLLTLLLAFTMTPLFASVSGGANVTSDYFFRGESQTMGSSAIQGNVDYSNGGFYAGVWASTVDLGMDTEIEYDFYSGYTVALDDLAIDVGVIQYNYDGEMDSVEEYYIVMNYAWASFGFWFDQDNSNADYTQIEIELPFITFADVTFRHGEFGDDTDYQQITISKSINDNFTLGLEVVSEESTEIDLDERMALYLSYNF